jgi:hypothetical protein
MPFAFDDSRVNCLKIAHMSGTYVPDGTRENGPQLAHVIGPLRSRLFPRY